MNTYEFTLILAEPEQSEADADALYANFDDGSIITTGNVTRIEFDREAPSLREAVTSAIADVEKTSFRVTRVEPASNPTIAELNADLVSAGRNSD